jgi:hypothetical protein
MTRQQMIDLMAKSWFRRMNDSEVETDEQMFSKILEDMENTGMIKKFEEEHKEDTTEKDKILLF